MLLLPESRRFSYSIVEDLKRSGRVGTSNMEFSEGSERLITNLLKHYPNIVSCLEQIKKAFFILKETFTGKGKLLVCGNGGSAADAEHISGELMKGFLKKRPLSDALANKIIAMGGTADWVDLLQENLPVIPLSTNTALISAICNDLSSELIFAEQVLGYGLPGDALLAISTSGSSTNVIRAVIVAKSLGLRTIGLTGITGGVLKDLCAVTIQAPADETYRIQEYHLPIYHLLAAMLEEEFF